MKAFFTSGEPLKQRRFTREKKIYRLLGRIPSLMEKDSQFRLLSINIGPEKGPDFIGLNKKGHLILGEVKAGSLRNDAWTQVKTYGKKYMKMRQKELEQIVSRGGTYKSLCNAYKGFLSKTAQMALLNPSRRRLQFVLVAERFSDGVLNKINSRNMGYKLRNAVKDIKCMEVCCFKIGAGKTIAVAKIILGSKRKLSR